MFAVGETYKAEIDVEPENQLMVPPVQPVADKVVEVPDTTVSFEAFATILQIGNTETAIVLVQTPFVAVMPGKLQVAL